MFIVLGDPCCCGGCGGCCLDRVGLLGIVLVRGGTIGTAAAAADDNDDVDDDGAANDVDDDNPDAEVL